ncbi:unnamed protein product [Spirodela intermedia]|uniref:Uncharacterized protein n=1 Tax=Spirodela intermedia TaxID=51605 RepID=A0A7I8IX30_SPIIN|nr:unnamed protein product [Spirodela intermedia]CAA6662555.1 unnamed protein product [Spirodela intermedia]
MKMLIAQEMISQTEAAQKVPGVVAKLMGLNDLPSPANTGGGAAIRGRPSPSSLDGEGDYCKDVCEISSPPPEEEEKDGEGNARETGTALVRRKFVEAKRLAEERQLLQSREFLEVLDSNRDLLLRFIDDPGPPSSSSSPATKRITVLKPSRVVENGTCVEMLEEEEEEEAEGPVHPTRIVVLKPGLRKKTLDLKAAMEPPKSFAGLRGRADVVVAPAAVAGGGARELAMEITQIMRESLSDNWRDETLLSSVFSCGYAGDTSSFNRSEDGFMEDDDGVGDFSDLEIIVKPDYSQDYGSPLVNPHSPFFLGHPSCSPESSVIREAKKRLLERWTMVTSRGARREERGRGAHGSSSTLGEVLSLPETSGGEGGGEQELRPPPPACSSPRRDERSVSMGSPRSRSGKFTLRDKVSSLLFSRSKRLSREGPCSPRTQQNPRGPAATTSSSAPAIAFSGKAPPPPENAGEDQDQPSPVSVLEARLDDDVNSSSCSRFSDSCQLVSRSPPIGSVARSLPWNGACSSGRSSPRLAGVLPRHSLVKSLLSSAGFEETTSWSEALARWHSPESPLDPLLLRRLSEIGGGGGEKWQRSTASIRLLFDSVNAALLEIAGGITSPAKAAVSLNERVWWRVKQWLQGAEEAAAAEWVSRKEAVEEMGREIEGKVLAELVVEALGDVVERWR